MATIPSDINPLSPNGFRFSITKLPAIKYFCQDAEIPGLSLGGCSVMTPLSTIPIPGDVLEYESLTINFLVDEKMDNYKSIYNWMVGLGFPEDHSQYRNLISESSSLGMTRLTRELSDGVLQILDATNNPVQDVQFVDMYPKSLKSVKFASTHNDIVYIVGIAEFEYQYYKML